MNKHSKSSRRSEATLKRAKARGPVQRDVKEVMAEVLGKLTGQAALDARAMSGKAKGDRKEKAIGPNRDRFVGHAFVRSPAPGATNRVQDPLNQFREVRPKGN